MAQEKEKKKIHMFLWLHQEMIVSILVLLHLMNVSFCKAVQFLLDSLNYRWAASAQRDSLWIAPAAAWDANHPLWREEKKKEKAAQSFGESDPQRANLPFFTEKKSSLTVRGHMSVLFCACTGDVAVVIHAWLIECEKPPWVTLFHSNKRSYSTACHFLSLIN